MSGGGPDTPSAVPPAAAWLGAAGVLPFVAGTAALWTVHPAHAPLLLHALLGYGAVILSFMGAVHWGFAMTSAGPANGSEAARRFSLSVVPPLVGWAALLLPPLPAIVTLAAGFAGVYLMDREAIGRGIAPVWYARLRAPLSTVVISLVAASGAALGVRLG